MEGNEIGTARVKCIDPGQTRTQTFRSRIKLVKSETTASPEKKNEKMKILPLVKAVKVT